MTTYTFLTPNTRTPQWKEELWAKVEGKETFLVEPDKAVLDFLRDMQHNFTLVDPQHLGANTHTSAIKYAQAYVSLNKEFLQEQEELVFVTGFKIDLDILGALALFTHQGSFLTECIDVIDGVDNGVFFGEWNPQSVDNNTLLLTEVEVADTKILGAMSADFKTPLDQKVAMMATWLQGESAPEQYKAQLLKERELLLQATTQILSGIKVVTCQSAGVSSLLYLDTEVAGKGVPVGIAFNPNFRGQGAKYSVLQFKNEYLDAPGLFNRLNELEEAEGTWGGNPALGIGGSPLGTTLSPETVAAELVNFLTEKGKEFLQ